MADGIGTTTLVFGFIAFASSIFMSISPVPFFWRILKIKNTEEFHPYPFAASYISHVIWILYCIVQGTDQFTIKCLSVCCWIGLTFDLSYIIIFLGCCSKNRTNIIMMSILVTGCFSVFSVFIPICSNLDKSTRKLFLGTLGVLSGCVMHLSPLSNIIHVFKTKSSAYMPFLRCITMYLNCICWLIFSCMKESFNQYLVITNGVGILLGLAPLIILYKFYDTPPKSCVGKLLEATLDIDPRKEIVVLNRICPRCKGIMFDLKETINFNPDTIYMLYQIDGSKSWRVNAAATATKTDILESYRGVSERFDKLSRDHCAKQASYDTRGADQV